MTCTEFGMDPRPSFRRGLYTEHMARLAAACDWLAVDRGRAVRYGRLITEFFQGDARTREHILAYGESWEIVDLYELWERRIGEFPGLAPKLKAVFREGPLLQEDEKPAAASNRARNDAFGYLVAGQLLAAGVSVVAVDSVPARDATCASEADVSIDWRGRLIDIECKRPQSHAKLEERTKEAREQIDRPSRGARHGVIALDCSVIVRPAGTLLDSDSGEAAELRVSTELKAVVPKVEPYLSDSTLGFLLFARVPAMTRVGRSPIVSAQGRPIHDYRPDAITTWLVVSNAQHAYRDTLREVAGRLLEAQRKRGSRILGAAGDPRTDEPGTPGPRA
jgi:hypothetical protein